MAALAALELVGLGLKSVEAGAKPLKVRAPQQARPLEGRTAISTAPRELKRFSVSSCLFRACRFSLAMSCRTGANGVRLSLSEPGRPRRANEGGGHAPPSTCCRCLSQKSRRGRCRPGEPGSSCP